MNNEANLFYTPHQKMQENAFGTGKKGNSKVKP